MSQSLKVSLSPCLSVSVCLSSLKNPDLLWRTSINTDFGSKTLTPGGSSLHPHSVTVLLCERKMMVTFFHCSFSCSSFMSEKQGNGYNTGTQVLALSNEVCKRLIGHLPNIWFLCINPEFIDSCIGSFIHSVIHILNKHLVSQHYMQCIICREYMNYLLMKKPIWKPSW